jgi:hypothetical protein
MTLLLSLQPLIQTNIRDQSSLITICPLIIFTSHVLRMLAPAVLIYSRLQSVPKS